MAGLIATAVAFHLRDVDSWLWVDEGIAVGLASHPVQAIPGLLRQDGSPPLYYVLLHGWMNVFGRSEAATHSLSLLFWVAAIPVGLWAGWSLVGRRTGVALAVLVAFSPYLSYFATETRMYALVALLALVATASFLHAFVYRHRRYAWLFGASVVLLLYTHNWGLWFTAAAIVALVPCALWGQENDRRRLVGDALLTFGAIGLAYVPWLPTLGFQADHTGAPWSTKPVAREMISVVADVLGDPHERVVVALVLVAGPVLFAMLRARQRDGVAVASLVVLATVPVALGWVAAQLNPSWAPRYLAVCAPAVLLVAALGLAAAGRRGVLAFVLILAFWVQPLGRMSGLRAPDRLGSKSTVKALADAAKPLVAPGDLVIAMQMEEVPVLAYYLPRTLRFATAMGPVADRGVADWRDALARMQASTVATSLTPQLDSAAVGSRVLLVCARPDTGPTNLPWFALMQERCGQWQAGIENDGRFVLQGTVVSSDPLDDGRRPVLLFSKTRA